MYSHAVIIGGTGMLRAASIQLAGQSRQLTSVAHTRQSLNALDGALPEGHGAHHRLTLDWSEPEAFIKAITQHLESTEQPDLVVAWVHNTQLGVRLAASLGKRNVQFFHVIGSAAANPAKVAAQARGCAQLPRTVAYHQVILGAVRQGAGMRWLTNSEISGGVLAAIHAQQARFVVGTLDHT